MVSTEECGNINEASLGRFCHTCSFA